MRKVSIVCLMCVFLFFQGYSQNDSLPAVAGDTITKDSVSVIPKQGVEPKVRIQNLHVLHHFSSAASLSAPQAIYVLSAVCVTCRI